MTLREKRAQIEATALRITNAVTSIKPLKTNHARKDWLAPPKLVEFQHLEPWGWDLDQDTDWIFIDSTPDVVWPIDIGIICDKGGDAQTLRINRLRSVTMAEVRGYAHRFSKYMLRSDHAMFDRESLAAAAGVEAWVGGKWINAINRTLWEYAGAMQIPCKTGNLTNDGAKDHLLPELAMGLALKHRYEWAVSVGLENSLSVRFVTDPTGIKYIFKIRDLPPGSDRREALLTWVGAHWRQDRRDDDMELYVRKHLRGALKFNWRGLQACVLPAPFDVEQRDKLIAERQQMRVDGTDHRARRSGVDR